MFTLPDPYLILLASLGVLILLVAWLPMALTRMPLSLPIFCLMIGIGVFSLPFPGDPPDPRQQSVVTEHLTELVVVVALMGAGLKLDRPLEWRGWMPTWRLLGVTMPLSIAVLTGLGWWMLGLPGAVALLLAASLAPTDPVLAADVQVGPPRTGEEDEVRFSLTSEAGLNDGLAFPFVTLALTMVRAGESWQVWTEWVVIDVVWRLAAGIGTGWAIGRLVGWLAFQMPLNSRLARSQDGFVSLGVTILAYAVTEMIHGYGFLAVFVTALALRQAARDDDYHHHLHGFVEAIERLLMMIVLVLFGGAVANGLLQPLGWCDIGYALLALFVVRPVLGWFALGGLRLAADERAITAFFGIRGIGSFYYLAYALNRQDFGLVGERLWAITALIVILSVLGHGTTVTPLMRRLDHRRLWMHRKRASSDRN